MKTEIKYAPQNLNDVIYPNNATKLRIRGYATKQLEGHIILHGPNGTSKTSIANLLPYAIDGKNAAIESKHFDELLGMKNLKIYLENACHYNKLTSGSKLYLVFNEFDNASAKINKLWTAIDDLSDMLILIITTNNPEKINKSLRDRCNLIEMPAVTVKSFLPRAQHILKAEGLVLPDYHVQHLLNPVEPSGSLRKYCRCLDELIFLNNSGLQIPAAPSATAPVLTVVKTKSK